MEKNPYREEENQAMHQRQMGKSDVRIGEIGLGCWQFGGDFGPMNPQTAQEIMAAAIESGTNFFDTADVYGAGLSETWIGEFRRRTGKPSFIATKFGRGADVYPDRYTEAALRQSTEASLKRLGVEAIDLLQLHCIPMAVMQDGRIFEWLRKLQAKGKIKHFGASVETVDEALLCLEVKGCASLQVIFNLFRQKPVEVLFPKARERGVGIIVRLPLASGLLTGKFSASTHFVDTDHRSFNRDGQMFNVGETFAGLPFEKGVKLADGLKLLVPSGMTMGEMSLRWILDYPEVSVIIPGASSPLQAKQNARASGLPPLSPDLHHQLSEYYRERVHDHIRGPY
jgi:aryl-alcohol dehydrogenase-like predicted oxidoreductase